MQGLVHIYTGDGKGKTTAALGLGVRACGRGLRVLLVQFLKGENSGELQVLQHLGPAFEVWNSSTPKFVRNMNDAERREAQEAHRKLWQRVAAAGLSGEKDLIILDEAMAALAHQYLSLGDVIRFIKERPEQVEIVMTGRNAPPELVELADYVSEIRAVKHPYEKGIPARRGIEF